MQLKMVNIIKNGVYSYHLINYHNICETYKEQNMVKYKIVHNNLGRARSGWTREAVLGNRSSLAGADGLGGEAAVLVRLCPRVGVRSRSSLSLCPVSQASFFFSNLVG